VSKNQQHNPTIDTKNIQCRHDLYYYEVPDFYISQEEQSRLYNKYSDIMWNKLGDTCHYTSDEFFIQVREKYPFLSEIVTFSITHAGTIPVSHIDAPRNCSFNFPINNCGPGASTVWFDLPGPYYVNFMGEANYGYFTIMGKKVPIAEYTLDSEKGKACLFRTTLPHCVVNETRDRRVIVTWTIADFKLLDEVVKSL